MRRCKRSGFHFVDRLLMPTRTRLSLSSAYKNRSTGDDIPIAPVSICVSSKIFEIDLNASPGELRSPKFCEKQPLDGCQVGPKWCAIVATILASFRSVIWLFCQSVKPRKERRLIQRGHQEQSLFRSFAPRTKDSVQRRVQVGTLQRKYAHNHHGWQR